MTTPYIEYSQGFWTWLWGFFSQSTERSTLCVEHFVNSTATLL